MFEGHIRKIILAFVSLLLMSVPLVAQDAPFFAQGNLVVVVEGCGVPVPQGTTCTTVPNGTGTGTGNSSTGGYGDNQATPLTLFQYTPTGTSSVSFVNSLVLPQTASVANLPVSGEYGSSSEGTLQLSGTGQYLTLGGYGVSAATYNMSPLSFTSYVDFSKANALAQSSSLTGQTWTAVPRVVVFVDANGNVNSSTALYNIFNQNNIRSVFTANGTNVFVSGQGSTATENGTPAGLSSLDNTGGVFYSVTGAANNSPTSITSGDAGSGDSQETNDVQIFNNTLFVSMDSKEGSYNRSYIGTLGSPPATSVFTCTGVGAGCPTSDGTIGPALMTGFGNTGGTGKATITSGAGSNGNSLNNAGLAINISPSNFFFASSSVLYVADTGSPKNSSNTDAICTTDGGSGSVGDGGLQKWVNSQSNGSGTWSLKYTLYLGLNLQLNQNCNPSSATGTTGLYGLTGTVSGSTVYLYATNYTIADLDKTYLYGITDCLLASTAGASSGACTTGQTTFTPLDSAPPDSNFKGVSLAPTLPAGSATITSLPSGLAFTSANSGCAAGGYTASVTLIWTPGSSCALSVVTPQSGGSGVQYVFSQWQDGITTTTDTFIAPSTSATYTATFTTQYQLITAAGTGGSVSAGGFVTSGTSATVTATPAAGYYFVNFTGTTTSTTNPLSIQMNQPQSITANFAPMATHFTVSAASPETAGTPFTFTVTALDQFNNTATGYLGTVHLTSNDIGTGVVLPANYQFTGGDGVHTFTPGATLVTAGSQTITATDTAMVSITGFASISVNAATATHFAVSAASPETAGTPFSFTVAALDQFSNTATGYAGTVHFTSSDTGAGVTLPVNYTFTVGAGNDDGVHTFTPGATLVTAGSRTITATDTVTGSITGFASITVIAATATHFTVSAASPETAGTPFSLRVTALDQFSNTAMGYTGTVHFTSSDTVPGVTLPVNYTFTVGAGSDDGVHMFTPGATLVTAGTRTITATDTVSGSITGFASISVIAATATHFTVSAVSPETAGSPFSFTVAALDQFGNTATGYTGVAHCTSSDTGTGVTLPANYMFTGGDAGVHTFTPGATLVTAGSQTITATDTVLVSITGFASITVSPGTATHFAVSAPGTVTPGTSFNFTVTALDQFNNTATAYAGAAHFTSSDTGAGVTLPANYGFTGGDAGVHTFTPGATLVTSGLQTITATDTTTSTITGISNTIALCPCTIWSNSTVPTKADNGPDSAVELGVKFTSSLDGTITGMRFYKSTTNTGTHVGNLWSSTGTLLATATFTSETASGWQQVTFSPPVAVTANTVYVASYHTNVGHYSADQKYFATAGVDNPPLQALGGGINGLYKYGASAFPNNSFNSTNYWVDVVFTEGTAPPPPSCTSIAPCTIWSNSTVPTKADNGPDSAVELGVKFTSSLDGTITGMRFYKSTTNTGTHVGNLWSSTGTLLATATFTSETASGWQQVTFSPPVAITANMVYVASYHTNVGHYSADQNFFTPAGTNNPPLQALANGSSGGDGVYLYGLGGVFPTNTYNSTNYWVDVVFQSP